MNEPVFFRDVRVRLGTLSLLLVLAGAGCATVPPEQRTEPVAQARALLQKAERAKPDQAVGYYLDAAQYALALAADHEAPDGVRAPGEELYNQAVAECAVILKKREALPSGKNVAVFQGAKTSYALRVGPQGENPARYDRFVNAGKVFRKHLKDNVVRQGAGGALVGVIKTPKDVPNRPPAGYLLPLTAVMDFGAAKEGRTPVDFQLLNPVKKDEVTLDGSNFQLKGDFTAPLAYFPRTRPLIFGFISMMRSDLIAKKEGIFFLEPFDSKKIPVLFVHGLMSSPHAWIDFVNQLDNDPEFRERFQPWVLFYPSGGPIAGNAMRLREQLAEVAQHYPLKNNLVLVGHSMGGIISQLQVTNSKRVMWDTIFGKNADKVYAMFPKESLLKRALIFEANPHVERVIFISTPHRGSRLADLRISSFVASLIRMPVKLVKSLDPRMRSVLRDANPSLRSIPTSIIGLSPANPMLKGMNKLEIVAPYNSIIGNRGKPGPIEQSSDGIVAYWSSHLDGAQSELIVPTGHDAFNNPASVKEVLRILEQK